MPASYHISEETHWHSSVAVSWQLRLISNLRCPGLRAIISPSIRNYGETDAKELKAPWRTPSTGANVLRASPVFSWKRCGGASFSCIPSHVIRQSCN